MKKSQIDLNLEKIKQLPRRRNGKNAHQALLKRREQRRSGKSNNQETSRI
jgi:hypothetical protein